jgi:hypothetical protein
MRITLVKLGSYWQGEESAWQSFENYAVSGKKSNRSLNQITDQATLLKAVEFSKNHSLDELTQNIAEVESTLSQLLNDHTLQNDTQITHIKI